MKQRGKLLRLRPFNMANFSSGAGMLVFIGAFASMFVFPPVLLIWAGFALPVRTEYGEINYPILVKRLNRVLLPICIVLFCVLLYNGIFDFISFQAGEVLSVIWTAAFPTLGLFLTARISAARLYDSHSRDFTKGWWLVSLLLYTIALIVIGALGLFLFLFIDSVLFFDTIAIDKGM